MAGKIIWDETGKRFYETGVSKGVLYPISTGSTYGTGVAWNGLTSVSHSPEGAEDNDFYADNIKYLVLRSTENFKGSIGCYSTPKEFDQCDGTIDIVTGVKFGQQGRKSFGLCYKTQYGNDLEGSDYSYKLHIIYGCSASPSEREYATINDSPEPIELSFDFSSTPISVDGYKPVSHIEIDSSTVDSDKLASFEEILYGKDASGGEEAVDPRLPLPDEVISHFNAS